MTDDHDPSEARAPIPGEHWSLANVDQIEEAFRLLAIPSRPGYTPAAITVVGVLVSPTGEVARYPLYAQVIETGTELTEATEVRAAIAILRQWLRAQWPSGPDNGPSWPPAFRRT